MHSPTSVVPVDAWTQTLGLLSQLCGSDTRPETCGRETQLARSASCAATSGMLAKPASAMHRSISLSVIERPTSNTVTIAWRDPTHCSYGNQLWYMSQARRSGVCALSDRAIRHGDLVYRPGRCRPRPLNDGAMILASILCELEAD